MAVLDEFEPVIHCSIGGDETRFQVSSFIGSEALSTPFSYTITLQSKDPVHDFDELLESPATLKFGELGTKRQIHGMLCSIQQAYDGTWKVDTNDATRLVIVLVPKIWKMTLNVKTRYFMKMTVSDIIMKLLNEYGLTGEVPSGGPQHESILQYQESDLDLIQRLCERDGVHYHFEHGDSESKIVFANSNSTFQMIPDPSKLPMRPPPQGMPFNGPWGQEKTVSRFQSRQKFMPKTVILNDYYEQTMDQSYKVEVDSGAKASEGVQYYWGENYPDRTGGSDLAKVIKEDILARRRVFLGSSNAYMMYGGSTFDLTETDAVDPDLAKEYVITDLQVEGRQPLGGRSQNKGYHYTNSFTCLPKDIVYRPPQRTRWPEMLGLYEARVIASGDYADIDDEGKYKVRFMFDLEGTESVRVRMMQPSVGAEFGFHSPLTNGQEVLVAFENGDPDRPIIVAAAHTKTLKNHVTSNNHEHSVWKSMGQNTIDMDDTKGSEVFLIKATQDMVLDVKRDTKMIYGRDTTTSVGQHQTSDVTGNSKSTITGTSDLTVTGAMTITGKGGVTVTVSGGDHSTGVTGNHITDASADITAHAANVGINADSMVTIEGGSTILLQVGGSSISIDSSSITLSANQITIDGSTVGVHGGEVKVAADASGVFSGGTVDIKGTGPVNVKGAVVQVN